MKIVHHRRLSCDLVAVESFWDHARSLRPENMVTLSALLMVEMIENFLGFDRLTFDHGPISYFFQLQPSPTIRTNLPDVDWDDLIGRLLGMRFSPMPFVTWTGSPL